MVRYYEIVKLENEIYPWSSTFPHDVKCTIPLTSCLAVFHTHSSISFKKWMTLLVKAYPKEEYKRLQKSLLDMPIRNPEKTERFPRTSVGGCSPKMKSVEFVNTSNGLSQSTQISSSQGAWTENGPIVTSRSIHPAKRNVTHSTMVIDASASSCPQTPGLIPLSTSNTLHTRVPRRRGSR